MVQVADAPSALLAYRQEVEPMSEAVTQILAQVDRLSQQERAELAYAFLRSLEPEEDGVAEAWDAELSRRVADIKGGQAVGEPSDQVFAELRARRP
jgi:putative addiction module component (TIGR02574 family)